MRKEVHSVRIGRVAFNGRATTSTQDYLRSSAVRANLEKIKREMKR